MSGHNSEEAACPGLLITAKHAPATRHARRHRHVKRRAENNLGTRTDYCCRHKRRPHVPASCARAASPACAVHVHYHGCTLEYPHWSAMHLGLHEWAEANEIMVLHPRVRWIESGPLANYGCWDWEGSTGAGFDTHEGLQLRTVINMLEAIGRLGVAQFVERYQVVS